jgi:hypothetical protein
MKRLIAILSVLPLLAIGNAASAQMDLTCDDIQFTNAVLSRYPDARNGCIDVVVADGELFAKMTVELLRTGTNRAVFRFKHPDGSFGPTQRADLDPDWRAEIGGREYRIRELQRGQELNLYLPSDRWEADLEPVTAVFVVYNRYALYDDYAGALPATASDLPIFAAFGGAALFTAFLMRIYRRRRVR